MWRTWLVLIGLWASFFAWYTSFKGPLTNAEIDAYLARVSALERTPDAAAVAKLRRFMEEDTGGDFIMLNLGYLYEVPRDTGGTAAGDSTEAVLSNYLAFVLPALLSRASHPVQFGSAAGAALELLNADGMAEWDNTLSMRYRSRRDFMDFATDPGMPSARVFKLASVERAIAFPVDPWYHFGDLRFLLALILALIGSTVSWLLSCRRAVT
ncbi:MAG: hypothetical protein AAF460_10670, partial [Pseudomonadota bacterium]